VGSAPDAPPEPSIPGPGTTPATYASCTPARFADGDRTKEPGDVFVVFGSNLYAPRCLRVRVGQTVEWVGAGLHPLRGRPTNPVIGGPGAIPASESGTARVTFTAPGFFGYFCPLHVWDEDLGTGMAGTVEVVP
jgi:plastocyanin